MNSPAITARIRMLRRLAGTAGVVLVAISPFIVYATLRAAPSETVVAWPRDVALITSSNGSLATLSLLHFRDGGSQQTIVRFPSETSLDVPDAGSLRALTAHAQGGAPLLARALSNTLGISVPYWAEWDSLKPGGDPRRTNLGASTERVVIILAAAEARVANAPGAVRDRLGIRYFTLDKIALQLLLAGELTPSPSASPGLDRRAIQIEVLNRGGETGAAAAVASLLQSAGYADLQAGNSKGRAVEGVIVYYRTGASRVAAEDVAELIGERVASVGLLPGNLETDADILVLVGRDTSSPSPSPSPSPSASSPSS